MTGPHQSIMACLVSMGHGRRAHGSCGGARRGRSACGRLVGKASSRWNCVGTMCEVVTLYCSISLSIPSGSHLSMSTTVWPRCSDAPPNRMTAVWYSGDPMMWTLSSSGWMPKRNRTPPSPSAASSGETPGSERLTPFGWPVVPDV